MQSPLDQAQQFAGLWMDYASKMMQMGLCIDPTRTPPDVARQLRSMTFQTMAQYTEEFMRSPEFLEAMKESMDAAVAFRKQMNDFLTSLQHNVQGVARQDIDSLMLTVRHIETRLLDSMSAIAERLEAINSRLDAIEERATRNGDPPHPPQSPRVEVEQAQ